MKKKLIYLAIATLMTACGNSKTGEGENLEESDNGIELANMQEDISQPSQEIANEDDEEGIYKPPFQVTTNRKWRNGPWNYREEYIFELLKHGRLKGSHKQDRQDANRENGEWEPYLNYEFEGKWSTSSIAMGDGLLLVYAIDRNDSERTYYMPATCEYLWMCQDAWLECENWNTNMAYKIDSVKVL